MICLMFDVVIAAIVLFKTLLTVDSDGSKSLLVHFYIFPIDNITFISVVWALFHRMGKKILNFLLDQ